mmetsp:Transcript_5038/g.4610  ORF Transcript_5038/g.4610 Transcript_5038/m.4610 type:complete len:87 (+) Transcript_5038:971-1231(+)
MECLQAYLRNEVQDSRFPLKCPGVGCKAELNIEDIKHILDNDELDKYYNFTFNQAMEKTPDASWCPTANCKFAFIFEDGDTELKCP